MKHRVNFFLWVASSTFLSICTYGALAPRAIEGQLISAKSESINIDLGDSQVNATVLVFLSAKCPCSASHESALKELVKEYSGQKIRFVAIHSNVDESKDLVTNRFSNYFMPVIEDAGQKIANQLGAVKTPHVFIFQKGEQVYQGGVDDSTMAPQSKKHFLKDALIAISQGKKPELKMTRALGCAIKRI